MNEKHLLTEDGVLKTLLRLSLPFLAANIIQALYGAVDLWVIGRYCPPASVAAVSTGTQVTQIITSMVSGLTLGGTILVGRYTGLRDEAGLKKAIGTTLALFSLIALALTAFFLMLTDPILTALKTPAAAFALAGEYVRVCAWGIFFICGYNAISAILRGYGDSARPMLFVGLACLLNIVCDIVFVKYFDLGVRGVALATILAQAVSMFCAVFWLNRGRFVFRFTPSNIRIDLAKAKELAIVGVPISLQECMVRLSFLYLTAMVNGLGVNASAAVGVASKYDVFAMLPATSVASALAAFTAQNYGAGKPERAKTALWAGLGFAFSISACFFLWAQLSPASMIGLFATEAEIIEAGIPFFRSCSYDYLAVAFVFCLNGYLNGRGQTGFTMISCCFGALCLRMPLIWLACRLWPENLLAIGAVAPLVSGVMAVYTLIFVRRRLRRDGAGSGDRKN